jgi:hypothetical protein
MSPKASFDTFAQGMTKWAKEMKLINDEIEKKRTVILHPESQFARDPEKAKVLSENWSARENEQIMIKLKRLIGG